MKTLSVIFILFLLILNYSCINESKPDQYKGLLSNDSISEDRIMHLSFDDVIQLFADITENQDKYSSVFENKTLKYFKSLNEKYGVVISCYCYYTDDKGFYLSSATSKFKNEFEANSDWLKFGFHGYNNDSNYEKLEGQKALSDYNLVISSLLKVVGGKSIDRVPRLHMFKGNESAIEFLISANYGITGLLSADDDRITYYFDQEESNELRKQDYYIDTLKHITIYPTDLRMERIDDIQETLQGISNKDWNNRRNILVCFTHEWLLSKSKIKNNIKECLDFAIQNNYKFGFLENRCDIAQNDNIAR